MRAVIQRVTEAAVHVDEGITGSIENGLTVLLGVKETDTERDIDWIAGKIAGLRIFNDEDGKLNLSVKDVGGSVLLVSQFTLLGDARKGRRPSYKEAAGPEKAYDYYQKCGEALQANGLRVEWGRFQAHMRVSLVNDGPVTILLDSEKEF